MTQASNTRLAIIVAGILAFFLIGSHYFLRFIEEYQATERTRIITASRVKALIGPIGD